jgi:nucleoid DNA-binding protein
MSNKPTNPEIHKDEIIQLLLGNLTAKGREYNKTQVEEFIDSLFKEVIPEQLEAGRDVSIKGYATFERIIKHPKPAGEIDGRHYEALDYRVSARIKIGDALKARVKASPFNHIDSMKKQYDLDQKAMLLEKSQELAQLEAPADPTPESTTENVA